MSDPTADNLRQAALNYHEFPKPGKLEVRATKPLANGRDLARAYSPGVAEASIEIQKDPLAASRYTARGNLVAVISNGSAVLGLGNTGALASKPVMEGKALLFKYLGGVDAVPLCIDAHEPKDIIQFVEWIQPSYPVTTNPGDLVRATLPSIKAVVGEQNLIESAPQMGGEDFSLFQKQIPGVMFWLGIRNEARGITGGLHTTDFDIDEAALPVGVKTAATILLDYLKKN